MHPVRLHRILEGELPRDPADRKRRKPDLEALAPLLPCVDHPHGSLLALGSGSRPNRCRAFVLALDADAGLTAVARPVDLDPLYLPLRSTFPDLNIEGAFVADERLHLLQRGNQGDARNACIDYPLAPMLHWLAGRAQAPPPGRITLFDLGTVEGVALGFTDGTPLPGGGWLFSAVAEDTRDSFHDGACAGAAIGWVDRHFTLQRVLPIDGAPKVEGIALVGGRLLMVTDADDPDRASQLLSTDTGVLLRDRQPT